jgi:hypothetical protein
MWESGLRHAPAALYPRERTPGAHCTGGWVGTRVSLDVREKNPFASAGDRTSLDGRPGRSQTLY